MTFSIRVDGMNRVKNSLRKLAALDRTVLEPTANRWAQGVRGKLKSTSYPPRRPNQRYRRTGRLANSWAVNSSKAGAWTITNKAEYGAFVVGDKQAWMHKGRWWQARPIVEAEIPALTEELSRKIAEVWERG